MAPIGNIDLWSFLDYKLAAAGLSTQPVTGAIRSLLSHPTWVPPHDRRRLDAYHLLAAYRANAAGAAHPDRNVSEVHEYGDANLVVARFVAGVLGDLTPRVVGAEYTLDRPDIPTAPDTTDLDPDDANDARIIAELEEQHTTDTTAAVDEWINRRRRLPRLKAAQRWATEWWEAERLKARLHTLEATAIAPLGDGALVVEWSPSKNRPVVTTYDPAAYFPVIDDTAPEHDYPTRVHFAWQYDREDSTGKTRNYVRRITYALEPIQPADPDTGTLYEGDRLAADGITIERTRPDGETTTVTCYKTDASHEINPGRRGALLEGWGTLAGEPIYHFTEDGTAINRLDMRVDFLPVIHVPHEETGEHYGRSVLAPLCQLLDDLASNDTDHNRAAALAAFPVIGVKGNIPEGMLTYSAGWLAKLGDEGDIKAIDLSSSLEPLRATIDHQLDRLANNSRLGATALGRTQDNTAGQLSGTALRLRLTPYRQTIEEAQRIRGHKYALLVRMAWRTAATFAGDPVNPDADTTSPVPTPRFSIEFGEITPGDLAGIANALSSLLAQRGISRRTAVQLVAEATGGTIDDIDEELARIRRTDFEGAQLIATALADEAPAAEYLDIEQAPPETGVVPPTLGLAAGES